MRHSVTLGFLIAAALFVSDPVAGQRGDVRAAAEARPVRVPVTVALVERLPFPEVTSLIVRRPAGEVSDDAANDIILLSREAATPEAFSEAVRTLLTIRANSGDAPATRLILRLRPSGITENRGRRILPWAQRVLADLSTAQRQDVDRFGSARSVLIYLPAQTGRGRELDD